MTRARLLLALILIVAAAGALYFAGVLRLPSTAGIEKLQDPGY